MAKRIGNHTVEFENNVCISSFGSAVGKKEGAGPLGKCFDKVFEDEYIGQKTFESAESALMGVAISYAMNKAKKTPEDIDCIIAGDLLDQSMASTFGVKDFNVPEISVFGACSASALELGLGAMMVDSKAMNTVLTATSSHFCTAERQFRFPLEYGSKRTPNSQRTVVGAGSALINLGNSGPLIKRVTFGRVVDYDVTDANNMGAVMAPAAADTIKRFLEDTNSSPKDYDLILTGDLGLIGKRLLIELLEKESIDISSVHDDCGLMIFDISQKDFAAGGSGCGCSGSVLCSKILTDLKEKRLNKILFCATGALLSPTSTNQGLSIPAIAHLVEITSGKE